MNLAVFPNKVLLDGHDLLKLKESVRFLECFSNPSRRRDIPTHPSGSRVCMVWDHLGFVAYEDRPEGMMSHFYIAFDPKKTPGHPSNASNSIIEINGGIVTGKTLERTLPRNGPTQILADFGKRFFYETATHSVYFGFDRQPNPHGRYPITGRLFYVSFIWRKRSDGIV